MPATADARVKWIRGCVVFGLLSGMALSWRLWIGPRHYPRAPWFELPEAWQPWLERTLAALLAASLLQLLYSPRALFAGVRVAGALACVALAGLWALDQSRLQPWAYLYGLLLLRIAWADGGQSVRTLEFTRLLLACTYFWSGLQKLHVLFGQVGLTELVKPLWPGFEQLPDGLRIGLGLAIAAFESAIGIGLLVARTRTPAAWLAIAMHVLLLLVLAVGLQWNAVVWPWNLVLAALAFHVRQATPGEAPGGLRAVLWGRDACHRALLVLLGVLPALSFLDRWDAYPSLALYSPRIEAAKICFGDGVKHRLPADFPPVVETRAPHSYELWLEQWSQQELGTPAYPSARVLRAVAKRFCTSVGDAPQMRVVVWFKPDAVTGVSSNRVFEPREL
jgi:hypothetical protein